MLILDNDGRVPYLQYNRAEQKLEKDLRAIGGIEGFGRPSANHAPLSCGASSSLADTGRDRTDDAGGGSKDPGGGPHVEHTGEAITQ